MVILHQGVWATLTFKLILAQSFHEKTTLITMASGQQQFDVWNLKRLIFHKPLQMLSQGSCAIANSEESLHVSFSSTIGLQARTGGL